MRLMNCSEIIRISRISVIKTSDGQTFAKKIDVVDTDSLKNFLLAELKLESSNANSFCSIGVSGATLA